MRNWGGGVGDIIPGVSKGRLGKHFPGMMLVWSFPSEVEVDERTLEVSSSSGFLRHPMAPCACPPLTQRDCRWRFHRPDPLLGHTGGSQMQEELGGSCLTTSSPS